MSYVMTYIMSYIMLYVMSHHVIYDMPLELSDNTLKIII